MCTTPGEVCHAMSSARMCGAVHPQSLQLQTVEHYIITGLKCWAEDTLAERLRRPKRMGSPRVGSNPTGVDCCVFCSRPPCVSQFQASVAGTLCQARLVPLDQRLGRPTPPRQMWSGAPQALSCQCSCIPGHSRVQRHDAIFPKARMGKNMVCHGGGCRG